MKTIKAVNNLELLSSTDCKGCQSCQQHEIAVNTVDYLELLSKLSTAVKAVNSFFFSELDKTKDITTQISIQTHLTEVE